MNIDSRQGQFIRIAKGLVEAAGYLELGMIQHALERLDLLARGGSFQAEINILRGEALRQQRCYASAVSALNLAARRTSSPYSKAAWLALSLQGQTIDPRDRAVMSLPHARDSAR
jgi:hypothetical protein